MKEYKIKESLLQAVLNYLQEQTYKEVYGLINALMQCKPVEEEKE